MSKQPLIENLEYLKETKEVIKEAIRNKGVEVSDEDTFRSYSDKIASIAGSSNLEELKEVNPSTSSQSILPSEGFEGMKQVVVNPVTPAIDANIKAENIKKDISILGISGTFEGEVSSKSNIYRVTTIEERNAITDMVEGDMCVVYSGGVNNMQPTDTLKEIYFPEIVTLPEAVTVSKSITSGLYNRIQISPTYFRFVWRDSDHRQHTISYTSEDAINYIRDTDKYGNPIILDTELTFTSTTNWVDYMGYFIQISNISFEGLFTYTDNAWGYTDIKCLANPELMFDSCKAYTSEGIVQAALKRNNFRKDYLYFQAEEPEEKKGVWCTLKGGLYNGSYSTNYPIGITMQDVSENNNILQYTKDLKFKLVPQYSSAGSKEGYSNGAKLLGATNVTYNSGSSETLYGIIIGNKYYGLNSSTNAMYLMDLEANTRITLTSKPSNSKYFRLRDIGYYNNIIYFLYYGGDTTAGINIGIYKYYISNNSWSLINLGTKSLDYGYPKGMVIDTYNIYVSYANMTTDTTMMVDKININSNSVTDTLIFEDTEEIEASYKNKLKTLFNFSYNDHIYNSGNGRIYGPNFDIDISTFTVDAIIEQIKNTNPTFIQGYWDEANNCVYTFPYQRNYMTVIKDNITKILPYKSSDGTNIKQSYNLFLIVDNVIKAFYYQGTKLYTLDLDNTILVPNNFINLQVDDDSDVIEISEKLMVNLKNVWSYNYTGSYFNDIAQVYIGDGTSWNLIKDNTI